jgi:hypothetical protein
LLASLRSSLGTEEFERVRVVFEGAEKLLEVMEQKRLSIARLRNMIFGAKTETGHKVCKRPPKDPRRHRVGDETFYSNGRLTEMAHTRNRILPTTTRMQNIGWTITATATESPEILEANGLQRTPQPTRKLRSLALRVRLNEAGS